MKKIILLFTILCFFSCKNNKLGKQLSNFVGTEIVIPENMQASFKGVDTILQRVNAPLKMIVWYDSLGCSSCQIQKIYEWDDIISYGKTMGDIFEPVFIFSPKEGDHHAINIALRSTRFNHPVYIDTDNSFYKNNPGIPTDNRMHTFLIDENNKVILVGNPVKNDKLWDLYKEQVANRQQGTEAKSIQ